MITYSDTPIQRIEDEWLERAGIELFVKREDLNHPFVSGNKWWKLKYNLEAARLQGASKLLTFGGAYSNHIFATSAAAKEAGFESIGIIRGERPIVLNSTLEFASSQGMKLHYISREDYRKKTAEDFLENLKREFGDFYHIPEGGTNPLAIKGCTEWGKILSDIDFDYLCLPVGTGGTIAGLSEGIGDDKRVIGFSVLKDGSFLSGEVGRLIENSGNLNRDNWMIQTGYDFGGYAKIKPELENFMKSFYKAHLIQLEHVYTGKMMFGIMDLIRKGFFKKGSTILALHTGGLQAEKKG